ncbi:hypothetical protein JOS77_31520 [Chromobacterium haemolyticum]|nr:hypothetical protein JOS77_31520 [Chromobacterium haemolyticum]
MLSISDAQINALVAMFVWPFARIVGLLLVEPVFAYRGGRAASRPGSR